MAVRFNGISDRCLLSASSEPLIKQSVPYTLCAWAKSDSDAAGTWGRNVISAQGSEFGSVSQLGRTTAAWSSLHKTTGADVHISGGTVTVGKWTHIATRWDGSVVELIVDGLSVATAAATSMLAVAGTRSSYGYSFDGNDKHWGGDVADIAVYQDHLNLSEIRQLAGLLLRPSRLRQALYNLRFDMKWLLPHFRSRCQTPSVFTNDAAIAAVPGPPFVPTSLGNHLVVIQRKRFFTPHRAGRI